MKLSGSHILRISVLVAFLGLGIRLAWIASHIKTGWEVLAVSWHEATIGWIGWKYRPIQNQEPAEQAEFWLAEVNRILDRDPPPSPRIVMGAAWVMDSPCPGFYAKYMRHPKRDRSDWAWTIPELSRPELDYDAVSRAVAEFEQKCGKKCIQFAANATQLEPQNLNWWRMRALLLFDCKIFGEQFQPRIADWTVVLEEAAKHDPDNALYDYLAAVAFWKASGEYEWQDEGYRLKVKNARHFERGNLHFERGIQKKRFLVGKAAFPAVAEFLSGSAIPKNDQAEVAVNRLIDFKWSFLLRQLMRWQAVQADELKHAGDFAAAIDVWRRFRDVTDQVLQATDSQAQGGRAHLYRIIAFANIESLAEDNPGVITDQEIKQIKEQDFDDRVKRKVLEAAGQRLDRGWAAPKNLRTAAPTVAMGFGQTSAVCLLSLGLVGLCLARWLFQSHKAAEVSLGRMRHVLSWVLGYGLTFLIFGLAPARVISQEFQQWTLYLLGWVSVVCLLGWGARKWVRFLRTHLRSSEELWIHPLVAIAAIVLLAAIQLLIAGPGRIRVLVEGAVSILADLPLIAWAVLLSLPVIALYLGIRFVRKSVKRTGRPPWRRFMSGGYPLAAVAGTWLLTVILLVSLGRGVLRVFVEQAVYRVVDRPLIVAATLLTLPVIALYLGIRFIGKSIKRTGRLPWRYFTLGGSFVLCAVVLCPALTIYDGFLHEAIAGVSVPARGADGWSPESLKYALRLDDGAWQWALFQWMAYPAIYISLGTSLFFVALWYAFRCARHSSQGLRFWLAGPRSKWGGLLACASRSAVALGACCLMIFLVSAPSVLQTVEKRYQSRMSYVGDPSAYWATVQELIAQIEGETDTMQRSRDEVSRKIAKPQE